MGDDVLARLARAERASKLSNRRAIRTRTPRRESTGQRPQAQHGGKGASTSNTRTARTAKRVVDSVGRHRSPGQNQGRPRSAFNADEHEVVVLSRKLGMTETEIAHAWHVGVKTVRDYLAFATRPEVDNWSRPPGP